MRHLRAYQSVRLQCGIGKPHLPQSTVDQTEADDAEDTKSMEYSSIADIVHHQRWSLSAVDGEYSSVHPE